MKKFVVLTLIVTSSLLFSCKGAFTKTLIITRDQIQERVAEKFPIKRSQTVVTLVLSNPNIVLENGSDRIGLKADAEAKLPGSGLGGIGQLIGVGGDHFKGSVLIDGDVEYDPADATFYFIKGKVKELSIEGFPEQVKGPISELANAAASNNLNKIALFKLNEKDIKERAAKFLLKSVRVHDGKLEVTVGL